MPSIVFVELHNVGQKTYSLSGNSFTFDPAPRNIQKAVEVKWRIRRPGYTKKVERARYRYNETIVFSITGACTGAKRDELEWYAKRDALYRIDNLDLKTYHSEKTADSTAYTPSSWSEAQSQGEETVYVVFEKVSFTLTEAKIDWFEYKITARRVHLTRH